jgi:hypothetical protein
MLDTVVLGFYPLLLYGGRLFLLPAAFEGQFGDAALVEAAEA